VCIGGCVFHHNFDMVHVYPLENFRGYVPGLDFGLDWVPVCLGDVACFTSGHVIAYVGVHVVPIHTLF